MLVIEKKELLEIAKLNGLKPWQQEKHYIQAIMLAILAEQPLVCKGGTYLWFFHGLPRFSEDLDFTAKETLPENLPAIVSRQLELFGVQNENKTIANNATTLSFRISAKGPLNTANIDKCIVYVEISKREEIEQKPLPIRLDFPMYNLPTKRIAGMDLEEVAAEKCRAIMTRERARDLFDLYYLVEKKKIAFNQKLIAQKLAYYNKVFTKKEFLEKAKAKQGYYQKELKNLLFDELPEFKKTMQAIQGWLKK